MYEKRSDEEQAFFHRVSWWYSGTVSLASTPVLQVRILQMSTEFSITYYCLKRTIIMEKRPSTANFCKKIRVFFRLKRASVLQNKFMLTRD